MAEGFFTQGFFLLTNGRTTIEHVRVVLESRRVETAKDAPAWGKHWFSGPSLIVPFRPDANGYASIDAID
jgi:hypothetical protein